MRTQAEGRHPDLALALQHLLSSGGKRIRPAVALLTGEMLGGDPERLVTLAAAIELLHTATLVHDDLIDGALFRRGKATINARWTPAATVLTGDFIFSVAATLAAETRSIEAMRMFAETLTTIVNGEITQLFSSRGSLDRANYYQRIYAKTASLFELSTTAAALLSPVDAETVKLAGKFGHSIGMAFQIIDDILDFTGDESTVGKPLGSDLRQGLVTLPVFYYMEQHPDDPDIARITLGEGVKEEAVIRLVDGVRCCGGIEGALAEARAFVEEGLEALRKLPVCIQRQALEDLARYIVDRQL